MRLELLRIPLCGLLVLGGSVGAYTEDDHFLGAGPVNLYGCKVSIGKVLLAIELTELRKVALLKIVVADSCPMIFFTPFHATGIAYDLGGDWTSGFVGRSLAPSPFGDLLFVSPYGTGKGIPVSGCIWCTGLGQSSLYWNGTVDDLGLP